MNLPSLRATRRGVALILVLAFISLLSALLIAFFSSTSSSRREAAQYEAGVTVAQLSDTAQNIVIGQIIDGTKSVTYEGGKAGVSTIPPDPIKNPRLTYASQPGLIRTYGEDGKFKKVYKLYSSGTMVINDNSSDPEWSVTNSLTTEVPATWVTQPAYYTDLNQPVLTPDAQGLIVPPGTTQRYSANYPILDPSAISPTGISVTNPGSISQDGVDGFDLNAVPGYGGPGASTRPNPPATYNPLTIPASGKTGNPAPMPVQWIYVLQNGSLTSPAAMKTGTIANWDNLSNTSANKPTKANPIVGRIAFWTDDDTCKLNPNVNSEGTAWDVPLQGAGSGSPYSEVALRDNQPTVYEFQRYPGHPAMTSLSPVFGFLPQYRIPGSDGLQDNNILGKYYKIVPRVSAGGSMGGSVVTSNLGVGGKVIVDMDRLYASVDELMYQPAPRILTDASFLTRAAMQKVKFFLTDSAKTPEVTLFNTPRIGLWSLQQEADPNNGAIGSPKRPRSATDDLIAFCNTLGHSTNASTPNPNIYFFQRNAIYLRDPVNNRIAHTTVACGQLPPTYVMPSSQSTTADFNLTTKDGRRRNQELYRYLQRLTDSPVPGFGGKLTNNYSIPVRNQLLTEMFDMTRLTNCYSLNQVDPSHPRFEFAPARQMPDAVSGETQIVPVVPSGDTDLASTPGGGTKGFGRFPTVTEAVLIFFRSPATTPPGGTLTQNMRMLIALEPFTPNAGSWTWSPLVRYRITNMATWKINNTAALMGDGGNAPVNFVTARCGYGSGGNHNTAHTGTFANFRKWAGSATDANKIIPTSDQVVAATGGAKLDEEINYPFVTTNVPIDPTAGDKKFQFSGGTMNVEVHSGYADHFGADTLVQTLHFNFPAARLLIPTSGATDFTSRDNGDITGLIVSGDTVRSEEVDPAGPSRGDLRVIASMRDVPSSYFKEDPAYFTDTPIEHSLRNGDNTVATGGNIQSNLVVGLATDNFIAARGMKGATMNNGAPGDWDTAPIGFKDGAYINKPDDHYGTTASGDIYDAVTTTPNRQVSSAIMFGSLTVGEPWRTLCFTPEPAASTLHPNLSKTFLANQPRYRDHLLLDLFTMPVVEPFAISEPMSSMGKVNLNYQIAPFSYITRTTALQGVLKTTRMFAAAAHGGGSHLQIDPAETLKEFQQRFDDPKRGMFRSTSEICDMHLVPKGTTLTAVKGGGWWNGFKATGDNGREAPYGQIYARTCTKSNTFTIHMRVQTLRKRPPSDPSNTTAWGQWDETQDNITGEYRGSATVERYVDAAAGNFPDFANDSTAVLDKYYKIHIIQTKRFNP